MSIKVKAHKALYTPEEVRLCNQIIACASIAGIDWRNHTVKHHHELINVELFYNMIFSEVFEYGAGVWADIADVLEDMYIVTDEFEKYDVYGDFFDGFINLCEYLTECELIVNRYLWMLNIA